MKTWFFRNINKFDKSLARKPKKKNNGKERSQVSVAHTCNSNYLGG
jgi:hypothetical protein